MEVNRLLSDELSYELRIRGLTVHATVEEKRAALRRVFRTERENNITVASVILLPVENELEVCRSKLTYLGEEIVTFNYDNRRNEFERLYTRLMHVHLRLGRVRPENDSQNRQRSELVVKVRELIGELNLGYDGVSVGEQVSQPVASGSNQPRQQEVSILDLDNPLLPEVLHSRNVISASTPDAANDRDLFITGTEPDVERHVARHASQPAGTGQEYGLPPRLTSPVDQHRAAASKSSPLPRTSQEADIPQSHAERINQELNSVDVIARTRENVNSSYPPENWSRLPNEGQWSNMAQTLTSHESTPFVDQLAALNLSPVRNDYIPSWERERFLDPTRWNVKYDGISSVNNFLDRVEEVRMSRGLSKPQLLRSAAELFTRDALLWYRTNRFSSWDDLVMQLREAFQPYDYENGIWEELRRRTQGAQERVVIFVASMEQLFNRLSVKPSEETRVRLIRRNLLPYIQAQISLQTFVTVREMTQNCKAIEETEIRIQRFCPPPTNHRYLLEPELAYRKPIGTQAPCVSAMSANTESAQPGRSPASLTVNVSQRESATCWNCHGSGHRFRQCGQPRLHKKPKCGPAVVGSLLDPNAERVNSVECKAILDYVFAHAKEDKRPYLNVSIYGRTFLGLLDSGCTTTVIGASGWKILQGLCQLDSTEVRSCTVANGQTCESIGHVTLPIQLCDRVKLLQVLIIPSIPHELILGVDFWTLMGIVPDLFGNEWSFRTVEDSVRHYIAAIHPMDSLTEPQRTQLTELIDGVFSRMGDKLGCTDQVELVIRTNSPPIKQRRAKPPYPELSGSPWLRVVPKESRKEIIREHHDPPLCGHLGVSKTCARLSEKFYWPKLRADVARYIRNCLTCLETKPEQKRPAGKMLSIQPTAERPWQLVSIDLLCRMPLKKVFSDVSTRLEKAYSRSKDNYNLRRRDERFQRGQLVWKRNHVLSDASRKFTSKLATKFSGPYKISRVISPWTYELTEETGRTIGVWHAKDLKAHPPDDVNNGLFVFLFIFPPVCFFLPLLCSYSVLAIVILSLSTGVTALHLGTLVSRTLGIHPPIARKCHIQALWTQLSIQPCPLAILHSQRYRDQDQVVGAPTGRGHKLPKDFTSITDKPRIKTRVACIAFVTSTYQVHIFASYLVAGAFILILLVTQPEYLLIPWQ
ncbi:hypothetical protein NQ317_016077 [Molorchus minor]|uniref:RNA-directed DNA polymerase n=1 Tax=Molorchus minor TaxID=1323400 RepID=A0ABQ9JMX4_9CUCU|nr:hypothetical protein NQ317_016077 [Molorchus minor]